MLLILSFCFLPRAIAQGVTTTLVSTQTFPSSSFPSGWSGSYSCNTCGAWYWDANGNGGSNGSAGCDVWDYSTATIGPATFNASSYAGSADSIWVDFDFCWEYSGISGSYPDDHFEVFANSDRILYLATSTDYTYKNPSDYFYAVDPPTSSADWRHYHVLVPASDRTSSLSITFEGVAAQGITNPFIDNVTVTGYLVPPAELSLTPKGTVNFGTATPNSPDTVYFTINSVGVPGPKLGISSISLSGSNAYSIIPGGAKVGDSIARGGSETIGIQFLPFTSGILNGALTVTTNGSDSGTQTVNLTGVGAVPGVSYNGTTSLFRGVNVQLGKSAGPQYVHLTSTGVGPLTIKRIYFIGVQGNNYFVSYQPPAPMPPGTSDSIGVMFAPTIEGVPDAKMVIQTTAANIPWDTIQLYGVGILPHLADYPVDSAAFVSNQDHLLVVNFDSVAVGTDSCMSVTLSNPGSDTLAITKNYLAGKDFDFTYTPLTGTDTLIAPGASKNIQVCFTPLRSGYRTATVALQTNIPPTFGGATSDTSKFFIQFNGTGVSYGQLSLTGPSTIGNVNENTKNYSGCETDTAWNTGGADLTLTVLSITGPNASDFTTSGLSVPVTIPAGGYKTFEVCSSPKDSGAETATLTGTTATGETATLGLNVYGLLISTVTSVGSPLPASTCLGDSDAGTIVVTNYGNVPDTYTLSITGPSASDFTIKSPNPSAVIPGGQWATFIIEYKPSKVGSETAEINTTRSSDNATGGPLPFAGSGGASIIAGDTSVSGMVGQTTTFTVPITNTGTCTWTPGIPAPSTDQAFTYVSGGTTPIMAGSSGSLTYTYSPKATGSDVATLSFPNEIGTPSSTNVTIHATAAASGVATQSASNGFVLGQSYPNPTQGTSEVEITVPTSANVQLAIVDIKGNVVQTVLDRRFDAGTYNVALDASGLTNGTYFYTLTSGAVRLSREWTVVK